MDAILREPLILITGDFYPRPVETTASVARQSRIFVSAKLSTIF